MIDLSSISFRSGPGRALRGMLAWIPRGTTLPILQGPLRGRRWIVGAATHGCWLGTYEIDKQRIIRDLLRPGAVFFDLGANVGFHTLLASTCVGPTGKVVSFEPVPENVAYCRHIMELNRAANVRIVETALADFVGHTRFAHGPNRSQGALDASGGLEVAVDTLDHWLAGQPGLRPDFMKIDVEGAELAVLRGADKTIRENHPTLLLATHGREVHADCCRWLRAAGYALRSLDARPVESSDELIATAA